MIDKINFPIIGATVLVGIVLDQFGNVALVLGIFAIITMVLSLSFIWFRVAQLTAKTSELSDGVSKLNSKVSNLQTTMKSSDVVES